MSTFRATIVMRVLSPAGSSSTSREGVGATSIVIEAVREEEEGTGVGVGVEVGQGEGGIISPTEKEDTTSVTVVTAGEGHGHGHDQGQDQEIAPGGGVRGAEISLLLLILLGDRIEDAMGRRENATESEVVRLTTTRIGIRKQPTDTTANVEERRNLLAAATR
jgi:hypothetical protein